MFRSIWDDIKFKYKTGNSLVRIIIVNIAVFVLIYMVKLFMGIFQGEFPPPGWASFLYSISISSNIVEVIQHPWSIFTHMFLHEDLGHIFWNLIVLYWFGNIVGELLGNRVVLPIYLLSGLAGAFVYIVMANFNSAWSFGGYALGASAAVNGIILAAGVKFPHYKKNIFIWPVKVMYVAGVILFLNIMTLSANVNAGGAFAHLGGALMGWLFVVQMDQGNDMSFTINRWLNHLANFFKKLFGPKRQKPKVVYKNPNLNKQQKTASSKRGSFGRKSRNTLSEQDRIDAILDKIRESGYESLSDEELEYLNNASKK